jgi:hypothetical protein
MGKRELLLIVAFVFLGTVVYQVAAPAGPARESRFSLSRMMEGLRRELRANSAEAEHTSTTAIPVDRDLTELRVTETTALTIVAEDRNDIDASLKVHSTGVDPADARTLAERTALKVERVGTVATVRIDYPIEGRQQAELALKVPKRLSLRLAQTRGSARLEGIQDLFLDDARGELVLTRLPGELRGSFQGGRLRADAVGTAKLSARRVEIEIDRIDGDATLDLSGGSLRADRIGGRLDLTTNRTEVEIDDVGGEVRANATDGTLELSGLKREARIDGRSTEMTITMAAAAPLTAFTNQEQLTLHLPPSGGVTVDATSTNGEIRVAEALANALRIEKSDEEQRARGEIRGGGPTISLRVTRGDIVIR